MTCNGNHVKLNAKPFQLLISNAILQIESFEIFAQNKYSVFASRVVETAEMAQKL